MGDVSAAVRLKVSVRHGYGRSLLSVFLQLFRKLTDTKRYLWWSWGGGCQYFKQGKTKAQKGEVLKSGRTFFQGEVLEVML